MTVPHVLTSRCNWCSKQRTPDRLHSLKSGQFICDYCIEWHLHAMNVLGGAMPIGCQECGVTWDELNAQRTPDAPRINIFVAPKDGINQVLCERCIVLYTGKRKDVYGGTKYGAETHRF